MNEMWGVRNTLYALFGCRVVSVFVSILVKARWFVPSDDLTGYERHTRLGGLRGSLA